MAYLLLAASALLMTLAGIADRRGYITSGWMPSNRADTLIGVAGLLWLLLFVASFAF